MLEVVGKIRRRGDVDAEERPTWAESVSNAGENAGRVGLIVDRVEGGDHVVCAPGIELRSILKLETYVGQPHALGFRFAADDGFFTQVDAQEPALQECFRQKIQRVPLAAPDLEHVDAAI